jgi:HK97 family phage prohead protease
MELPVESFLKNVEGDPDLYAFTVGGKALDGEAVVVEDNGDLILEGYAAVWQGDDREGENFAPGAFAQGTKAFLENGGPLCFHHKRDHLLGAVTELEEDDKGLRFKARVDGETANHPVLGTLYHQIKKGTLKGVSVGGFFKRALIAGKQKIADVDFTEISLTGVPIHTGPSFAVAGKALLNDVEVPETPEVEGEVRESDVESVKFLVGELGALFDRIEAAAGNRTAPAQVAAA